VSFAKSYMYLGLGPDIEVGKVFPLPSFYLRSLYSSKKVSKRVEILPHKYLKNFKNVMQQSDSVFIKGYNQARGFMAAAISNLDVVYISTNNSFQERYKWAMIISGITLLLLLLAIASILIWRHVMKRRKSAFKGTRPERRYSEPTNLYNTNWVYTKVTEGDLTSPQIPAFPVASGFDSHHSDAEDTTKRPEFNRQVAFSSHSSDRKDPSQSPAFSRMPESSSHYSEVPMSFQSSNFGAHPVFGEYEARQHSNSISESSDEEADEDAKPQA
ncbi:uncharacterized protein NESG_00933, partial [Nematocida ausubeli]